MPAPVPTARAAAIRCLFVALRNSCSIFLRSACSFNSIRLALCLAASNFRRDEYPSRYRVVSAILVRVRVLLLLPLYGFSFCMWDNQRSRSNSAISWLSVFFGPDKPFFNCWAALTDNPPGFFCVPAFRAPWLGAGFGAGLNFGFGFGIFFNSGFNAIRPPPPGENVQANSLTTAAWSISNRLFFSGFAVAGFGRFWRPFLRATSAMMRLTSAGACLSRFFLSAFLRATWDRIRRISNAWSVVITDYRSTQILRGCNLCLCSPTLCWFRQEIRPQSAPARSPYLER